MSQALPWVTSRGRNPGHFRFRAAGRTGSGGRSWELPTTQGKMRP